MIFIFSSVCLIGSYYFKESSVRHVVIVKQDLKYYQGALELTIQNPWKSPNIG